MSLGENVKLDKTEARSGASNILFIFRGRLAACLPDILDTFLAAVQKHANITHRTIPGESLDELRVELGQHWLEGVFEPDGQNSETAQLNMDLPAQCFVSGYQASLYRMIEVASECFAGDPNSSNQCIDVVLQAVREDVEKILKGRAPEKTATNVGSCRIQ